MEFIHYFGEVFTPINFLILVGGTVGGLLLGATPGLSPTMAVALLIPFTFQMEPASSLILLGGERWIEAQKTSRNVAAYIEDRLYSIEGTKIHDYIVDSVGDVILEDGTVLFSSVENPAEGVTEVEAGTYSVAVVPAGRAPRSRKPTTSGSSMNSGWPSIAQATCVSQSGSGAAATACRSTSRSSDPACSTFMVSRRSSRRRMGSPESKLSGSHSHAVTPSET